jgi:hypothetical protein
VAHRESPSEENDDDEPIVIDDDDDDGLEDQVSLRISIILLNSRASLYRHWVQVVSRLAS